MREQGPRLSVFTRAVAHWLAFAALLSVGSPLAAQQFTGRTGTGVLAPVATVDPLHPSAARNNALPAPDMTRQRAPRRLHPKTLAFAARPSTSAQMDSVQWASLARANSERSGVIRRNFDGVSSLDSANTNFGGEFEPPDQGLCVGNGFVIDAVNSAYTIYRRDGAVVAGPINVNALFDEGLTEFTSDPRCHFDAATHTWFAVILFISADNTEARTDIAVNTSGDPTKPWTVYHLDATDDGTHGTPAHVGCPCLGDQPLLGIDRDNLYVSTNEFSIQGPQFNGAQVYAVSKRDLLRGASQIHFVHFENLTIAGVQAASVQPAINTPGDDEDGAGGVEYFLQSIDANGTGDNRLGVWALTHPEAVADGEVPTLSNLVINSLAYGNPPGAVQKGATSLLDSGDDRMQQAQFVNGSLWGELDTALNVPGGSTPLPGSKFVPGSNTPRSRAQLSGGREFWPRPATTCSTPPCRPPPRGRRSWCSPFPDRACFPAPRLHACPMTSARLAQSISRPRAAVLML
jgi:hypothetical protein